MTDVHTIDLNFQDTPGVIAASVFDTGDGLALIDSGPTSTLPALEEGLHRFGAELRDLRHILLTHIHFDHAGAAGTLLSRVPRARVYVHERGAPHLARPEKLVASATQIYGDQMERLWGEMRPIDPERMQVLSGGEFWRTGSAEMRALYTPGHAVHHLAYHVGDELFVGDVGGVRLAAAQTPRAPTPPPDIDLERWRESVATLRDLDARTLHLAHFGSYPQEARHWDGLLEKMDVDAGWVRGGLEAGRGFESISEEVTERLLDELAQEGAELPARYEFACPPWMSVQGLMRYWTRRAARPGTSG
ncbi:MBL fold metallo-hydrolase [Deinococcus wulumuqiensis]|uniref:MBL fold hydrolase n=1 Tax=Deinococcus wulumuqiensis TaxID=980427 RepID=A0AAV4K4W1_9DEIO|nr:MBL fold metallo-hydrolase [Deinococcus wulumuqiensis]QII20270.1 MBL fold metallo-hydrolase [Deinococcus wulumuqiensis R12]GGI85359.1 MBL fold hydrolase [Deinococcus wulumuqiensis]GGP30053.1 MBL fold hydrolase [Deinococcus wulumuqiensis]